MKYIYRFFTLLFGSIILCACDSDYSFNLENQFSEGIYLWSSLHAKRCGYSAQDIDASQDIYLFDYIEPGQMDDFANVLSGFPLEAQEAVDKLFKETDIIMVAVLDAKRFDECFKNHNVSDAVIQKYWLNKENLISDDGKRCKNISFPPNEGMKDVEMEPEYGYYK